MWDLIKQLIPALVPPRDFSNQASVYKWSLSVSITVVMIGVMTVANTLLAWGFIPALYAGFATAGEVKTQQQQLAQILISQIEIQIRDAKIANCTAQREGNQLALNFSNRDLNDALTRYYNTTGHPYPRVPECSELIAAAR